MTWTLKIPCIAPSGNKVMRMNHWDYAKLLKSWWWLLIASQIPKATGKRRVTVTRYSKGTLDADNLAFSAKPIFDALRPAKVERGVYRTGKKEGRPWVRSRIGHGLILEDDPAHVERVVLNGKLAKGETPYTLIEIEDMDGAAWPGLEQ